jgi:hypothetical protein
MAHELRMKKEDENNSNLMNVQSEFVSSKESSIVAQEHVKHNKTIILDFSKAEGVVHFSSDYHIIGRRVQAKKNSENQIVENQDKGGEKKTLACRHKLISSKPGRPDLTGPMRRSDRPIQSVTVGCHMDEKYDIIHIKLPRLSNLFDKVCFASNSQSDPTFSINSFVNDCIINSSKRSIENGSLLASNGIPSDSTSQCIVKIKKADHKNTLTFKFTTSSLSKFLSSWCAYGYSRLIVINSKASAQTQGDDQLATIGFDGKGSLNRLASASLSKDPNLIVKGEDSKLPSDEKDAVHDLQDQAIIDP